MLEVGMQWRPEVGADDRELGLAAFGPAGGPGPTPRLPPTGGPRGAVGLADGGVPTGSGTLRRCTARSKPS